MNESLDFSKVVKDCTGGNAKIKQSDYLPEGLIPVVDQGQELIAGYVDDESMKYKGTLPCVIFGDHTCILKYVDFDFVLGADGTKILVPDSDEINAKYLYYFLNTVHIPDRGYSRHFKYLKRCKIPVVSLSEQKQIVQTLDTADTLRQKRKEQLNLLDDYLKSVFLEMFGDPVANNKNITQRKISDVGEIVTGNTPSRQEKEYYGNFIEWIKSDNINTPEFVLTKAGEFLSKIGVKVGRVVPKGSVLVTCIAGSPDCIGNCAISDREVAFNQQINAFIPGKEIKTEFFFAQLYICKRLVQQASTESMKGMVSKSRFAEIKILVPPIEEQMCFVKIFNSIAEMRNKMRASLNEMDNHFNALMQRYFG